MKLDFSRIEAVIDVARTNRSHVAVVGVGGSVTLVCDLVRSGVNKITLVDPDHVELVNVARQDHMATRIGMTKVEAVAEHLRQINPDIEVHTHSRDFCTFTDAEIDKHFATVDVLIMATDQFAAQAFGNTVALRRNIAAIFIGLYEGGQAAEVMFWYPGLDSCFRCFTAARYASFANGTNPPITSRGASIFDIRLPDTIAGMLAVGLLTCGAENRYGRLIDSLGDRQFLQVKIDPDYTWNGRDLFREQLGISADCPAYFSFVTTARSDPDRGQLPCPDCERYRGHQFVHTTGGFMRVKPHDATAAGTLCGDQGRKEE